jgi:hypothetical protein
VRARKIALAQRNLALATWITVVSCPLMIVIAVVASIASGSPQNGLAWMLVGFVILLLALGWQRVSISQRHSLIGEAVSVMCQHDTALTDMEGRRLFHSPVLFDTWAKSHPGAFNDA